MGFSLKSKSKFIVGGFYLILLVVIFNTVLAEDEKTQRRKTTEKELSQLQIKIKKLQERQAKNRSTLSNEQQALKQTDVLIGKAKKSLNGTRKDRQIIQSRLANLNDEQRLLTKNKKTQQTALYQQIKAAYAGGKQEFLKLILNQEDPALISRVLAYYDYLNKARMEKIQSLKATLENLKQV